MKKVSFFILSLLTLSVLAVDFKTGFEDNSTKNWMPFKSGEKVEISAENPAEGKYCLKVLPNGMKLNKTAYIKVEAGGTYRISAQLRATSEKVRFSVVEHDSKKDWLKGTTTFIGENTSSTWRYFELDWKAKNPLTHYITLQFDGGDGFADDIQVEKVVADKANSKDSAIYPKWEIIAGEVEKKSEDTFLLKSGKIGAELDVEKNRVYGLNLKMQGAMGQRVIFYYREFDENNNDLSGKDVLFAKTNTNDNEGSAILFFTTGAKTAKIKLTIRSGGEVNIREAEIKEAAKGKSDLQIDLRPDRYYYYPEQDGILNLAVYNNGKKMERKPGK